MNYKIEIPEEYLIQIAGCGKLGDGELMVLIKTWAQKECKKLGLDDKLKEFQNDRLKELKKRVINIIGEDGMNKLDESINIIMNKLKIK